MASFNEDVKQDKLYYPVKIGDLHNNRYEVVRQIGDGSSSTVWLSWDQVDKQFVALKVMRTDYIEEAIREIKLLKIIGDNESNDKVIQLLDDFEIHSVNGIHMCLVLEVMGDNLSDFCSKYEDCGISLSIVKSIIKQVLESLDYLHNKCKIIHADIKLENILICANNNHLRELAVKLELIKNQKKKLEKQMEELNITEENNLTCSELNLNSVSDLSVKIADFDNSILIDSFDKPFQTSPFRCPQVILGSDLGTSIDIWSVACMAFELATGHALFQTHETENYSADDNNLAQMIELLGEIPQHIAFSGIYSKEFFNEEGKLHRIQAKPRGSFELFVEKLNFEKVEARQFFEFLLPMLEFDPQKRISAQDCINHPWLQF